MFKKFEYSSGTIKVMLNEQYMQMELGTDIHEERIKPKNPIAKALPKTLGLEVAVHTGPRICYGLMSTTITSNKVNDLVTLSTEYTKTNSEKFTDSILLNNDYTYKGLPKEFLSAVINSAINTIKEKESFPLCDIHFNYTANCEAGSSQAFFHIIIEAYFELILMFDNNKTIEMNLISFEEFLANKFSLRNYLRR